MFVRYLIDESNTKIAFPLLHVQKRSNGHLNEAMTGHTLYTGNVSRRGNSPRDDDDTKMFNSIYGGGAHLFFHFESLIISVSLKPTEQKLVCLSVLYIASCIAYAYIVQYSLTSWGWEWEFFDCNLPARRNYTHSLTHKTPLFSYSAEGTPL